MDVKNIKAIKGIKDIKLNKENSKAALEEAKNKVISTLDQNNDGTLDIEDIITLGFKAPMVRVDREKFLRKELQFKCTAEQIDEAIASTPAKAGISMNIIDDVADEVIKAERNKVSGISAALGMPGGVAMVATIPAELTQYYGYMLHVAQELMYLYGFPEINFEEDGSLDSATMNLIIISLGAMYGVAGASNAIKVMANQFGKGASKQLMNKALTKGMFYPIVKSVAKWFDVKMTKEVFAGFFKKAIPIVGGVVGGGLTFFSFKPCCDRLKTELRDTMLSNPTREETQEDIEIIDVESLVVE